MNIIKVENLAKYFKVHKKDPGVTGSLKALFYRKHYMAKAVDNISFEIEEGELIGFIGPNGAGKTTSLKCLSGLLYPTSGQVSVLGFKPFDRKKEFLKQISLVMGQKAQLWWDLPAMESFLLNKEIYEIGDKQFKKTLDGLVELLDAKDILQVRVRNLSLGQRMKCELIAALIHRPKVLFLDEPTIGLDVIMQKSLRDFIKSYNQEYKSTIILTSHYMDDVKELCKRIIIINNGTILYDGLLEKIVKKFAKNKLLSITFEKPVIKKELERFGIIKQFEGLKASIQVPYKDSKHVAAKLLEELPIDDINIEDPQLESIIRGIFTQSRRHPEREK